MKKNVRLFFVLAIAAMAFAAVAAAYASAGTYDSENENTDLTATGGKQVFTVSAGAVECTTLGAGGTVHGTKKAAGIFTSSVVKVLPSYSGCTAFGNPATVEMNGCEYEFSAPVEEGGKVYTKATNVVCPTGKNIQVKVFVSGVNVCTLDVGSQTTGGKSELTNVGTGATRHITLSASVTNIAYTVTGGTSTICGLGGSTATYTGTATVKGYKDPSEHKTTDQIGIWTTTP